MSHEIGLVLNRRLPRQPCSTTAYTTEQARCRLTQTPDLEAFREKNGKRPATPDPAYLEPENPQTILVYDAWKQQSVVTVLRKRGHIRYLLKGEEAELKCHSGIADFAKRDDNAAAPREFALTLMIPDLSACPNKHILLDAMALLARDGGTTRAAKTARMAVLYNEDALEYNRQHGGRPLDMGSSHLALVHVNDAGALSMAKTKLTYKDSGRKVWKVLLTAISQLFKEIMKLPPECLMPSRDVGSDAVSNAFLAGELEANKEFWQLLNTHERPPSIEYALTQQQGEADRIFVKMVPHHVMATPQGLSHKDVSFGTLFYKDGMYEETKEFIAKVREEQRAVETEKNHGRFPPEDWPWGLRPNDQSQKELSLGLHVAWVKCDLVSFQGQLSCFGLEGAPGERVCVNDEAFMPRLNYYLQPLDAQMCRHYFVLPCDQESVNVLEDALVRSQWMVTERGFETYYGHCTTDPPVPEKDLTPKSPRHGFQLPRFVGPPSVEDEELSKMIGIPISSAFRIGDMYDEVEKSEQALPEFSSFLVCSSARWSPSASMTSALRGWVEIEHAHKAELEAKNERIRELESVAATASPVAPPQADVGPFEYGVVTSVLRGLGRKKSNTACVLRPPMEKGRILGISNALAKTLGRDAWSKDDEDVKWGMASCGDKTQLEAIVAVVNRLSTVPIVVVVVAEGHMGQFLLVQPQGRDAAQKHVSIADVLRLRAAGKAAFLQYTETEMKLFALVIDAERSA